MRDTVRNFISHPALALGSTLLWGMIELVALCRSRWVARMNHKV